MNQMAFGSSTSYGPACGKCYELTLLNTFLSDPPFYPSQSKSIVIKLTDLCPLSVNGWCDATVDKTNPCARKTIVLTALTDRWCFFLRGGHYINFDLVWPSPAIPDDFFPSNASLYGEFSRWCKATGRWSVHILGYTVSYTYPGHWQAWYNEDQPSGFRGLEYLIWNCQLPELGRVEWRRSSRQCNCTGKRRLLPCRLYGLFCLPSTCHNIWYNTYTGKYQWYLSFIFR